MRRFIALIRLEMKSKCAYAEYGERQWILAFPRFCVYARCRSQTIAKLSSPPLFPEPHNLHRIGAA